VDVPLAPNQNIAEETHILSFARNVIGVLYNHDGPRVGLLVEYLNSTLEIVVSIRAVLDPQTARRLNEMGVFTSVEITLPVNRAALLNDDPTEVATALREMASASLSKTLHVKAVIQGSSSRAGAGRWREFAETTVAGSRLEAFKKLKVHSRPIAPGLPGQTVDFVQERLVFKEQVQMQTDGSRRVQPASAFGAIRDARSRVASQLSIAVAPVPETPLTFDDLV
jgi:hypothetical protein